MNRPRLTLCLFLAALVALRCVVAQPATLTLSNQTVSSGATIDQATQTITAGPAFTINGSANVTFQAGTSITLLPGFTANANAGGYFKAYIAPISDYTINGTVFNSTGGAVAGATVTLGGSMSGSMTTGGNGNYSLAVAPGAAYSYTVTPSMSGQSFNPVSMGPYTNVNANITGVNFSEAGGSMITDLPSLQACVGPNGPAVCQLAAKDIIVNSTINVNRYGVTIAGMNSATDHTQTRLIRDPGLTTPIIDVAVPFANTSPTLTTKDSGQTGIVIENLTVCGGGNSNPNKLTQSDLHPAVMSPTGPCADHNSHPSAAACDYNQICVDLSVDSADTGLNTPNPFNNAGPYALEVNNVDFEDAAGHAISLYAAGPVPSLHYATRKVNDVWIHNSVINYSAVTGILSGFVYETYNDKFCDTYAQKTGIVFADDANLIAPRNIRIEYNSFSYNNTGATGFGPMRWLGLRDNTFFVNYISPQAGNGGGGSVGFNNDCSDHVDIYNNIITGPSTATVAAAGNALPSKYPDGVTFTPFPQTAGLELYGRNMNISSNTATAHGEDGIGADSLLNDPTVQLNFSGCAQQPCAAKITQNHVLQDNGWDQNPPYYFGGITLADSFPFGGGCDIRPRDTNGVIVTSNDSKPVNAPVPPGPATLPYGVKMEDHGGPFDPDRLFNVTVDSSNFNGTYKLVGLLLDPYVGLYNYSGQSYATETWGDTHPRALPIDVTDASSSTSSFVSLWPVPPLCADPQPNPYNVLPAPPGSSKGSPRAKFEFLASDLQGATNISQIQGVWSSGGNDGDGTGGPGGTLCYFLYNSYSQPVNTVYLWDYGLGTWKSSIVGGGGTDLVDSGYGCILHAASSSSLFTENNPPLIPKTYVMDLTLDVTLPPTMAHYHMYNLVLNVNPGNYALNSHGTVSWQYWGYWPNFQ